MYTMVPWFWSHRQSVTIPIVKGFLEKLPKGKIGVAGFCWGGRYALLAGQKSSADELLVDAVFTGHPSMVSIPADINELRVPASIAVASTDSVYSPKMAKDTEKLWKDKDVKTEIVIYEGAMHGFCVRGNMNDPQEKEHMQQAVEQVIKLCIC